MYRIIAYKGEIMFNQLISHGMLNLKMQELIRSGYTIVSCKPEKPAIYC